MTYRALELLALPEGQPAFLLDIGCGSGLSGEILDEEGYNWVGVDIAPSMLGECSFRMRKGGEGTDGGYERLRLSEKSRAIFFCMILARGSGLDLEALTVPSGPNSFLHSYFIIVLNIVCVVYR